MKKIVMLVAAALLVTGAAFAYSGEKGKGKRKAKKCAKGESSCCDKKAAKQKKSTTATL